MHIAQCMFCQSKYNNEAWVPSKLRRHLERVHKEHINKPAGFFKRRQESLAQQKSYFEKVVYKTPERNKAIVLTSLDISFIIMADRKPFTIAETTIKKCLLSAAERLHGGKKAVKAVDEISLSNDTMTRRAVLLGQDMKEQ